MEEEMSASVSVFSPRKPKRDTRERSKLRHYSKKRVSLDRERNPASSKTRHLFEDPTESALTEADRLRKVNFYENYF